MWLFQLLSIPATGKSFTIYGNHSAARGTYRGIKWHFIEQLRPWFHLPYLPPGLPHRSSPPTVHSPSEPSVYLFDGVVNCQAERIVVPMTRFANASCSLDDAKMNASCHNGNRTKPTHTRSQHRPLEKQEAARNGGLGTFANGWQIWRRGTNNRNCLCKIFRQTDCFSPKGKGKANGRENTSTSGKGYWFFWAKRFIDIFNTLIALN